MAEKEANEDAMYKKSVDKSTQVENMSTFDKSTQVDIVDNFDKFTQVENIVDKSTQANRIYQDYLRTGTPEQARPRSGLDFQIHYVEAT